MVCIRRSAIRRATAALAARPVLASLAVLLVAAAAAACASPAPERVPPAAEKDNVRCNECHTVDGLKITDPASDKQTLLTIGVVAYGDSAHGNLPCEECHDYGYEKLPHHGYSSYPRFLCVDCHEARKDVAKLDLTLRKKELLAGAHGERAKRAFDCHECHDPHFFKLLRNIDDPLGRIDWSNDICVECHEDLAKSHAEFPNPEAHFRKVKCVPCHTPETTRTGHDVLPAEESVRDCGACHSRRVPLFAASYAVARDTGRSPEGRRRLRAAAMDNAYVIGSTSSPTLDLLSLLGFLFILFLVCAHAAARLLTYSRRKRMGSSQS